MMWKRVLWLMVAVVVMVAGVVHYRGRQAEERVQALLAQAQSRGLRTDMRQIFQSRPESGTVLVRALEGIKTHRDLRSLTFDDSNVPAARSLVASSENQFETIAEFASLDVYSPPRDLSSGMSVQDYSTIATAMRAEAWRGYLFAVDNEFDEALASIKIQAGIIERLQDEGFAIGRLISRRGDRDIYKIVLELLEQNKSDENRIGQLLQVTNRIKPTDWRSLLEFELANGLLYIDEIESGKADARKQRGIGPLQFKVARSAGELNVARIQLLTAAIECFDNWDSAPLTMLGSDESWVSSEDSLAFVLDLRSTQEMLRRHERNYLAERRAMRLLLEAYRWKATHGKLPKVVELQRTGVEAKDPWTGEQLSLHQEPNGRIWVGAMREMRQEMPPRKPKLVDVLEWRP